MPKIEKKFTAVNEAVGTAQALPKSTLYIIDNSKYQLISQKGNNKRCCMQKTNYSAYNWE